MEVEVEGKFTSGISGRDNVWNGKWSLEKGKICNGGGETGRIFNDNHKRCILGSKVRGMRNSEASKLLRI